MKTKHLVVGVALLVAAAGGWAGRLAWRAHRQLVSLNVREMPLRQVLRQMEWQTWKKIRAEQALDARITLHVSDKPLSYVLDRVAEQAGAHWSTLYAVYHSDAARRALEQKLSGDGQLEKVGWSILAPKAPEFENSAAEGPGGVLPRPSPAGAPDAESAAESANRPPGPGGVMMFRRNSANGVMFAQNGQGQTERWAPEELLAEQALTNRLGTDYSAAPNAQTAQEAAQRVNGRWTSYLALRKSIMGVGFAGAGPRRPGTGPLDRNPNERFASLTPEQRVQRARERRTFRAAPGISNLQRTPTMEK
jgi:hypothetical protein